MADILPFLRQAAFDPETTRAMGLAFEKACRKVDNLTPVITETMAKCIIAFAQHGERDPVRLCEAALAAFGVRQKQMAE